MARSQTFLSSDNEQITLCHDDCVPSQQNSVLSNRDVYNTAALGGLKRDKLIPTRALLPKIREAAMGGTGDRILINANRWSKNRDIKSYVGSFDWLVTMMSRL
ncbi:MAG: hypothetical protein OSA98_19060 [Rubripirellula sp.]|nr:hypothetical protein [Rubripirellula sp.]